MRRFILLAISTLVWSFTAQAQQEYLQIEMSDGSTRAIAVSQIKQMTFVTKEEPVYNLPYESTGLSDFTFQRVINNPWSTGASYAQATGYQYWDSTGKTNKEAEGFLVSPQINTRCASGQVKLCFDYCVAYPGNDLLFDSHIKIFISKNPERPWNNEDWHELDWYPTHTSTSWTLKTEEIVIPEEYVNADYVHIAFWFYAPATSSCTFEVCKFKLLEDTQGNEDPITTKGTQENPFTVADALKFVGELPAGQKTTEKYYIKGYVTSFKNGEEPGNSYGNTSFYMADTRGGTPTFYVYRCLNYDGQKFTSADEVRVGDEVIVYGPVVNYRGNTPETVANKACLYSINGKTSTEK